MKYFATVQTARQDLNYGTGKSPKFGDVQSGWVFECESIEEIKESNFTPGDLLEHLQANCDHRFIEFASHSTVLKMTPTV